MQGIENKRPLELPDSALLVAAQGKDNTGGPMRASGGTVQLDSLRRALPGTIEKLRVLRITISAAVCFGQSHIGRAQMGIAFDGTIQSSDGFIEVACDI